MQGKLYLIPTSLGSNNMNSILPQEVSNLIPEIKHYIVENIRTARRFLKAVNRNINIDEITFYELNKHTSPKNLSSYLEAIETSDIGIISDAGCPGVADPGADVVRIAHQLNIQVVPLVGPSSILLSLMASGLNGQNFSFNGYIPIKTDERVKRIRQMEGRSLTENQTQIFIEAPYRNTQLLEDLCNTCSPTTRICVACDITLETEYIKTLSAKQWKREKVDLHKRPTIFLLLKDK